jgi:hypothetical protein
MILLDTIKTSAQSFRNIPQDATDAYISQYFEKECILILLSHYKEIYGPTTYIRNGIKLLNDCKYFSCREIARQLNKPKSTVHVFMKTYPELRTIIFKGRKYFKTILT